MSIVFVILFASLVLLFARQAWHDGVLAQCWGILGLVGGLGAGYLFFHYSAGVLERFAPNRYALLLPKVLVSSVIGLVVYFLVRGIAKYLFTKWLDSSLTDWSDGWRGAILSLVPSVITILFIVTGMRVGGTLLEFRHLENICRPKIDFPAHKYPRWPVWAAWRDSLEVIPVLPTLLGPIDSISRVPERRIVCLLVASKKPELFKYLQSDPLTATILNSSGLMEALGSDEVAALLENYQHVALIKHPLIHQAARDPSATKALGDLELRRLIDGFMLSPERQERIKNETVAMNKHSNIYL